MIAAQTLSRPELRLARYYVHKLAMMNALFLQGGEGAPHALVSLDSDWAQIEYWQAWAAAHAEQSPEAAGLTSDFARTVCKLGGLLQSTSQNIQWQSAGLVCARQLGDRQAELKHLTALSGCYNVVGDYQQIETYAQAALTLAEQLGDVETISEIMVNLAHALRIQGKMALAQETLKVALEHDTRWKNEAGMATSLLTLGRLDESLGEFDRAKTYIEQSLAIRRRLGDPLGTAECLNNLAYVAIVRGDFSEAKLYGQESLPISRAFRDVNAIMEVGYYLAYAEGILGNFDRARQLYEEPVRLARMQGMTDRLANLLLGYGDTLIQAGALDEAGEILREAHELIRSYQNKAAFGLVLRLRATLDRKRGELAAARQMLYESTVMLLQTSAVSYKCYTLEEALYQWLLRGDPNSLRQVALWSGLLLNHSATEAASIRNILEQRGMFEAQLGTAEVEALIEQGKAPDVETELARIGEVLRSEIGA